MVKKMITKNRQLNMKTFTYFLLRNFNENQPNKIDNVGIDEYWYLSVNFDISGKPVSIKLNKIGKLSVADNQRIIISRIESLNLKYTNIEKITVIINKTKIIKL